MHTVRRPVLRSPLFRQLVERGLQRHEARTGVLRHPSRRAAPLVELRKPALVHGTAAQHERLEHEHAHPGQRAPRFVEQCHVLILVLLHGAAVALRQLVPVVVHSDENTQHVRLERERIGRPAAREVGDLVAAHAAVVEPQRAIGMGRQGRGGDEQRISGPEAARQIGLAHLTIASRVGDRVALEQHREAVGRRGATSRRAHDARGDERRAGGDEVTTGQREGHESAIKINHQTRTGASRARLAPYPADRDHAGTITAMTAASPRATATVPLPPPVARPQDAPLRQDVRWLAGTLGRVVGRLAGEDTLRAVEDLRRACRARRLGVPGAPDLDALLARTRSLDPETARLTARAFTVFFILINAAEQAHRVRRARQDDQAAAQRGSVRWSLRRLREAGRGAEEVARALASLEVRPVLTAHPTESARRTILDLQSRLAEGLLTRDGAPEPQRRAIERHLEGEVELLWLTEEIRRDRPSVMDEVSNALWYLEDRLLEAASRVRERLVEAFEDEFGCGLAAVTPLTMGSWVGGDRDGNLFVTAEITLAAARSARRAVLGHYGRVLADLAARLSVSERLADVAPELLASLERDRAELPGVWEQNRRRNADEPLRLKVSFMRARVERDPPGYASPDELERDLTLVADALDAVGAAHAGRTLVEPLLAQVRAHGFHGYRLDVREDAAAHTRAAASSRTSSR